MDICYYNSKCEHPSGYWLGKNSEFYYYYYYYHHYYYYYFEVSGGFFCCDSFAGIKSLNNVYSNIAYIVVGLGFMLYVFCVRFYVKRQSVAGIPRDASIPYAMGLAILLEGRVGLRFVRCGFGGFFFPVSVLDLGLSFGFSFGFGFGYGVGLDFGFCSSFFVPMLMLQFLSSLFAPRFLPSHPQESPPASTICVQTPSSSRWMARACLSSSCSARQSSFAAPFQHRHRQLWSLVLLVCE
jgi:hypothetical protein